MVGGGRVEGGVGRRRSQVARRRSGSGDRGGRAGSCRRRPKVDSSGGETSGGGWGTQQKVGVGGGRSRSSGGRRWRCRWGSEDGGGQRGEVGGGRGLGSRRPAPTGYRGWRKTPAALYGFAKWQGPHGTLRP
ncbi:uncharacterized protein LOC131041166 [Cryptomeria japonica]|uniref:uncharacterized protein LOC131041166 n=1 Tax=Cryptomeria japonica TaxID=3369 RepID=UPI0027DA75FA|nr:uncharacterized protein LOC131041166 [Cryptomeria japonica]